MNFIQTWSEKRQKIKEALDTLSSYLEQYGYKPRQPTQKHPGKTCKTNKPNDAIRKLETPSCVIIILCDLTLFIFLILICSFSGIPAAGTEDSVSETQSEDGEEVGEEEEELEQETGEEDQDAEEEDKDEHLKQHEDLDQLTPERIAPSLFTTMATPKLTDFGLSELHLQNMLKNYGAVQDPTPVAPRGLLSPLAAPVQPPVPKTPKCYLKLDEDAPTPRLEDFGISEHTMCFNNDFTMDLLRKPPKPFQR